MFETFLGTCLHCFCFSDAPVAPRLTGKAVDSMKMKKAISKGVSEALENELRAKAFEGKKSLLSKKEIAEKAGGSK